MANKKPMQCRPHRFVPDDRLRMGSFDKALCFSLSSLTGYNPNSARSSPPTPCCRDGGEPHMARPSTGRAVITSWQGSHLARRPSCLIGLSTAVSTDVRCGPIEGRQPPEQDPQLARAAVDYLTLRASRRTACSACVAIWSSVALILCCPVITSPARPQNGRPLGSPRRQMRLCPHAVVDRVERDAKMACRANADGGLGFDPGIVEIALTNRARAATEQAGPRSDIRTRGP